ncbi:hypothetical protein B9G69_000665 [Bdellovibrio sp. SKB1291214]|uniref:hypothetical protein n=1 Tax=Bdellovibrio sp. SKB1291214 TaxID=1732569 RepID=UPI000B517B70|nr:hypothetical protein [Bdellovibrio sp. SKB1291214]UYL09087.1 hypothetical protein B9G69_000665 [Bdellovibrio sp. SKB1291214]
MKLFKFLAKYTLIFAVVSIVTVFTAIGGATYYVLNHIHEENENNHNLHEVMKIGEGYIDELQSFEGLQKMLQNKKMPPFCKTICNPSSLNQDMLLTERTQYLTQFYKATGPQALQDPLFRFKLEQMGSVAKAVPDSVRGVIKDVLDKDGIKSKNKVLLALKVETTLLTELPTLSERLESFKADSERLDLARTWIKACQSGANSKKIMTECQAEFDTASH